MDENSKNILITGGYGFMGSNFVRHLYQKYPAYKIFNLDALTYAGNLENLADIEEKEWALDNGVRRYHFIKGDICDAFLLDNLFKQQKFDAVVHFAAETHVDRSTFNISDFIKTNIDGTHLLIEAVRKYNVPRFVHISTDEVYGSVPEGFSTEDAPLRPSNPYSTSKACADLMVQSYMRTYRVPALIVRSSNNFGPYQYPEKLIPLAITNIIEGKKIPVHGDGLHVRCWLHVFDFCEAVDTILHQAPVGNVYNISGRGKTNKEVLGLIARALGTDAEKHITHTEDRPGPDYRYAPDSGKLQRELGWTPRFAIEEHIPNLAKWYVDNKDWWRKIKSKKEYQDHYLKQSQAKWY